MALIVLDSKLAALGMVAAPPAAVVRAPQLANRPARDGRIVAAFDAASLAAAMLDAKLLSLRPSHREAFAVLRTSPRLAGALCVRHGWHNVPRASSADPLTSVPTWAWTPWRARRQAYQQRDALGEQRKFAAGRCNFQKPRGKNHCTLAPERHLTFPCVRGH